MINNTVAVTNFFLLEPTSNSINVCTNVGGIFDC